MYYLRLLSLCLFVPVLLQGAASEEISFSGDGRVESLSVEMADMSFTRKMPANNVYTKLLYRQLGEQSFSRREKAKIEQKERERIFRESGQRDRSCVPVSFADEHDSFMLSIKRIKFEHNAQNFGLVALPLSRNMIRRGTLKPDDLSFKFYNRIEGIDNPFAVSLSTECYPLDCRSAAIRRGAMAIDRWVNFTYAEQCATLAAIRGLLLFGTDINDINCNELKQKFRSLAFVALQKSVPAESRVSNEISARGSGVDIFYVDRSQDAIKPGMLASPFVPSIETPEIKGLMAYLDEFESGIENPANMFLRR